MADPCFSTASGPDAVAGACRRLDNLPRIGYIVALGQACVAVAQAGISGSARREYKVVVAQTVVVRGIPAGATVGNSLAVPVRKRFRRVPTLALLADGKGN